MTTIHVCEVVNNHFFLKFVYQLGQIFLLVDLREFFSDLGSGGRKKNKLKSSENDQLTGHFQSFFFFFF